MVRNFFEFLLFFFSMGGGGFLVYLSYLSNGNGKKSGDSAGYYRNAHSIKMSRTVSDQNERTNPAAFSIRPALSPK